jgi:hypothetical protein
VQDGRGTLVSMTTSVLVSVGYKGLFLCGVKQSDNEDHRLAHLEFGCMMCGVLPPLLVYAFRVYAYT